MALSDVIQLEDEHLSFEGKVTSVLLTDSGGTITGRGNVSVYGLCYVHYNLTANPNIATQGGMTGKAYAIDDNGEENSAALHGVWERKGHALKIYCVDDISDGKIHLAVVTINLRDETLRVDFSRVAR